MIRRLYADELYTVGGTPYDVIAAVETLQTEMLTALASSTIIADNSDAIAADSDSHRTMRSVVGSTTERVQVCVKSGASTYDWATLIESDWT